MSDLQPKASYNTRNPLFLPEITHMIIQHVSTSHRYNLSRTCKPLFQIVVPKLWSTVLSVEQLLLLIPGTMITQERVRGDNKISITIPKSALTESWERYWVYAPHAKMLSMYGLGSPFQGVIATLHGWDILFAKRREFQGVLLPCLEWLDIRGTGLPSTEFDPICQLAWFTLFLSPTLKLLELKDYPSSDPFTLRLNPSFDQSGSEFPSPSALLLVNILAKSVTGHHHITLSSYYDCPTNQMLASSSLGIHKDCLSWFEHTPDLINLTRLTIYSCAVLGGSGEGLVVLGHLPHLEGLDIVGISGSKVDSRYSFEGNFMPIPPGLFPCLKSLHLTSVPGSQLFYLIWDSNGVVSNLTEARIHLDAKRSSVTQHELSSRIIPRLCKRSPNLRHLNISVSLRSKLDDAGLSEPDMLFELCSHLPLSVLQFNASGRARANPEFHLLNPPSAFPLLKRLDFSSILNRSQLRTLAAAFPNLQHISITLTVEPFEEDDAFDQSHKPASLQPLVVHARFENRALRLRSDSRYVNENLPRITSFFKSIWPNLSDLDSDKPCSHSYQEFL
ncbi:unnamed protein product [Rhizoctonia solani]|uniref:F-box domain-containing protein n=1 Tax=Rhizoctonia solani TaxID=456999 RepID=A0A8H3BGR3_9AGAM|nr:unnamed protein product [Rhizoctonia solani]